MKKTSEWLKEYQIILKKKYGQNFLSSDLYTKKIVKKSEIKDVDYIIEIGPGAGTLTEELEKTGLKVIAYEIDTTLKSLLEERFKNKNVEIIFGDFLKADLTPYKDKKIAYIANIPYNISSPILEKIFIETPNFVQASLMVQKEFGERIIATSGKNYSPLSVFVQYFCDVKKLLDVPKSAFIPNPKIDSVVLKLTKHNKYNVDSKDFFKFIHICFSQRRKTIRNNLKSIIDDVEYFLESCGIDSKSRPETISVEQYLNMYKEYIK
ncbi:ribosomal RNA small subunit methyltransferase A [Tepiditoga spiralis]|uniref:Ribosomal RNA small subunit methyltransferase A n=1 Tax=Tepiditoga spiralis TaxID=2108365 RepID=A0A7G1G9Z0_9BACT|nr:16S rRNA (adenine(1518)-N(6)/adenine(1519)-N(6))-dimethyltransferase RsmA [Tepiditoga spiralis]BBE30169.1 ribosomal RNA small subunit methyltransferase A [Tepiditoga spiralis]